MKTSSAIRVLNGNTRAVNRQKKFIFCLYIYVDIFIIVFYLLYYCNIRYVVLSFDEIKTH